MPRIANQKLKPLYLYKIFTELTDEEHPLTLAQLSQELERYGIAAERKSLYDDIEALRVYGVDIVRIKAKTTGYYIANRVFETAELKLLVDSVLASKFITHKKSNELIHKIEGLASIHEARQLQRQVHVANRIKSMNESIYYNVDKIHAGIGQGVKISFRYFEYTIDKERSFKKAGEYYTISPFALLWDDENYYMIGFDSEAGILKHYRVDKMTNIMITEQKRDGTEHFETIDMGKYAGKLFSMFGGEEKAVRLCFENSLIGVVIDRFGKDITLMPMDETHFYINVSVVISPQFFGWMAGLGRLAQIISPDSVKEEYRRHIASILE